MKIKKEFPILNWTIISPVEQYQQSFGYGWHYNLWEFVQDVIEDAKEEVKIPTDYVFLFVEKYPLNSTQRINEQDSAEKFPIITGQLDKYYTEYNNRRIIEAKAYYWAEEYIKEHDFMKVYMDTEVMTVYMIKQDGEKPYNLAN